jgi:GNAT superfamily N-acetyltransferase
VAEMRCKIGVERPERGAPYHDDSVDVTCDVDGERVGKIQLWRTRENDRKVREVMQVATVRVEKKFQRRGLGTQMYEAAAAIACESFGLPLASDVSRRRSTQAGSFWKKQEAKGRAVRINDRYVLSCPAPASLSAARGGRR